MSHDRRRSPRLKTSWYGRYELEDRLDDGWYACRVVDVSTGGAALELFGPAPLEDSGIHVELHGAHTDERLCLHARARYLAVGTGTSMRVGIAWHELTRRQAAVLISLVRLTYQRAS